MLSLTSKQKEYWNNANCRWNVKCGATRSGKTYLDYYFIPKRIRAVSGKEGLYVMLGNTKLTLQRNIIEPLQMIWGQAIVGDIKADNTAYMFGEKIHCIGADKVNQVNRLRGTSIKYCYGDEVVTWHEEVFNMLKSRLDKEYSKFDGTCNPEGPNHWFKKFIDRKDIDLFLQNYTIYDNNFLPDSVKKSIEIEYSNSVYFDRYVLGNWKRAEGIVFPDFADNPQKYIVSKDCLPDRFQWVKMGYDIGGNNSAYGLTVSAQGYDGVVYILRSCKIQAQGMKLQDAESDCLRFISDVERDYGVYVERCYVDDNYYTLVNTLNEYRDIFDVASRIKASMPLWDRPLQLTRLMAHKRFFLVEGECEALKEELETVVFDDKSDKAVILDDGSMQIDSIDSMWYSLADDWLYLNEG